MSKESKKRQELDSILDAALDELDNTTDDNNGKICSDSNLPPDRISRNGLKLESKNRQQRQNDHDLFSSSSLEGVMKSLLDTGVHHIGGGNDGFVGSSKKSKETLEGVIRRKETDSVSSTVINPVGVEKGTYREGIVPTPAKILKSEVLGGSKGMEDDKGIDETGGVDKAVTNMIHKMSKSNIDEDEVDQSETDLNSSHIEALGENVMKEMMHDFETMSRKDDADDVINSMMNQLLSKELMYEPMKQVTDFFPKWLAEKKQKISTDDYNRYGTQYQYFQRIVHIYETEPHNIDKLVELMQDIQEYGQPPAEIISKLAPDLEFDEEGLPKMDKAGMPGMPGLPFPTGKEECTIM